MISFLGPIPASKSMLNRGLIIKDFFPKLHLVGESDADDVHRMRAGLKSIAAGEPADCGDGGTVLRFLALRASRIPGRHRLRGSARLMSRPQEELVKILKQLGVDCKIDGSELWLTSQGWRPQGDTLHIPSARSSQFASAVLLSAWDLPFDLYASPVGAGISEGYWRMTQRMVADLGMTIDRWDYDFRIPAGQKINKFDFQMEPDMSSAFALAAAAAVGGAASILDFPSESLQPDFVFANILAKMGVPVRWEEGRLKVSKAARLQAVAVKLTSSPDLFPVLAVLCALAEGDSELYGAPQLVFKESNRIEKMRELLKVTGRVVELNEDGIKIRGKFSPSQDWIRFDPDQDHRLAMAAGVLKLAGLPVEIEHKDVVAKSFPGFWQAIGERA